MTFKIEKFQNIFPYFRKIAAHIFTIAPTRHAANHKICRIQAIL